MLPFPPANNYSDTVTKRQRDDEKMLWIILYIRFLMGYFSKLFFPYQQSNASPHLWLLFTFSTSFWALEKHFTSDQFGSCTRHVLTSYHPSFTDNGAGVSATTCCVQREAVVVCVHVVCSYESVCVCVCVCVCMCFWGMSWNEECTWDWAGLTKCLVLRGGRAFRTVIMHLKLSLG